MAKDPAFLFYTKDFYSGIVDLTMQERGQFITLLCIQHQKGHLTKKVIKIAVGKVSPDVISKFVEDEQGFLYNIRLEKEIEKRKIYSLKQSERAKKRWANKNKNDSNKDGATASTAAMPEVNRNVSVNMDNTLSDKEREKLISDLRDCFTWKTSVIRSLGHSGHVLNIDELDELIEVFVDHANSINEADKHFNMIQGHCKNWLAHQLEKTPKASEVKGAFANANQRVDEITQQMKADSEG